MEVEDRGQKGFRGLVAPRIPAEDGGSQCEIRGSSILVHSSGSKTLFGSDVGSRSAHFRGLNDTNSALG